MLAIPWVKNVLSFRLLTNIVTTDTQKSVILGIGFYECTPYSLMLSERCRLNVGEESHLRNIPVFGSKRI
jgi:hypothetical protein